jgi:hypothetical protein
MHPGILGLKRLAPLAISPTRPPSKDNTITKDVCMKEARAELVKGEANARVARVVTDTHQDAATKQAEPRKEANADKRDAEYRVAIEKCDALAAPAKDACIGNAKVRYGKS